MSNLVWLLPIPAAVLWAVLRNAWVSRTRRPSSADEARQQVERLRQEVAKARTVEAPVDADADLSWRLLAPSPRPSSPGRHAPRPSQAQDSRAGSRPAG